MYGDRAARETTHDDVTLETELGVVVQPYDDFGVFLEEREKDVDGLGSVWARKGGGRGERKGEQSEEGIGRDAEV